MALARYWTFLKTVGQYNVWTSPDGYYQVTKTKTPPDSTAGYANLETLLKLKGIRPGFIPRYLTLMKSLPDQDGIRLLHGTCLASAGCTRRQRSV